MILDLHVQTSAEAGPDVEDLILQAKKAGLEGVLVSDQKFNVDYEDLKSRFNDDDFCVLFGMEVVIQRGRFLIVHSDYSELFDMTVNRDTTALVHEQLQFFITRDCAVIACQPYDRSNTGMGDRVLKLKDITAVEVLTNNSNPNSHLLALEASGKLGIGKIAGSDSSRDIKDIGKVATLFKEKISNESELVEALKTGVFWPVEIGDYLKLPDKVFKSRPQGRGGFSNDRRGGRGGHGGRGGRGGHGGGGNRRHGKFSRGGGGGGNRRGGGGNRYNNQGRGGSSEGGNNYSPRRRPSSRQD